MTIKKDIISITLIVLLGAAAGYSYWYFIGCTSGACPIYAKWYWSTLYGGLLGYLVSGFLVKKKKQKQE